MIVIVTVLTDHRFCRDNTGTVWTETIFPYSFWTRYLSVFDSVRVLARVQQVDVAPARAHQANGVGVEFADGPFYLGPKDYLRQRKRVAEFFQDTYDKESAYILRLPGQQLSAHLFAVLKRHHHPYAAEIVADVWDAFGVGSQRHALRPYLQLMYHTQHLQQCWSAEATAYVTRRAIQRRYPPRPNTFTTNYSSIDLPEASLAASPRDFTLRQGPLRCVCVGTLNQLYKGQDVLVRAVALAVERGADITLTLVGDGSYRPYIESLVASLGLNERVRFLGQLPGGEAIQNVLDDHDLYVLPSRQEGLPRSMIEAMARGLPALGSDRGGIPELLAKDQISRVGDAKQLGSQLLELSTDPERLSTLSAQNLAKASEFTANRLAPRRDEFYLQVKSFTDRR